MLEGFIRRLTAAPGRSAFPDPPKRNVLPSSSVIRRTSSRATEREEVTALARRLGCAVADATRDRAVAGQRAASAVAAGMIRLTDGRIAVVPTPRVAAKLSTNPPPPERLAIATRQTLMDLAVRADGAALARSAAEDLADRQPHFSARQGASGWQIAVATLIATLLGLSALGRESAASVALLFVATLFFLALAVARLCLILTPVPTVRSGRRHRDEALPIYSVLIPAYREDEALEGLIPALEALDYPKEKLDILLLVEEDDQKTQTALERMEVPSSWTIIRVPPGRPQTKPRACNLGLTFARGTYLVIYDVEDRPAPDQLRLAVNEFDQRGPDLAVVQAQLTIDPLQSGLLARLFRLEYAAVFGVLLPALSRLGLPMPLGGTSNHFRTSILREAGGWDAYNVTEDADLGLRLARLGYRARTIASVTFEEAPPNAAAWLRQRTRWLKGWMVTMLVHGRDPLRLSSEVGLSGAALFALMTGGIVVSGLAEPLALALIVYAWCQGTLFAGADTLEQAFLETICLVNLVIGHGVAALAGLIGLRRLRLRGSIATVLALPLYWLAVSLAAWRALGQLIRDPYHWEKTDHVLRRLPPGSKTKGPGRLDHLDENSGAKSDPESNRRDNKQPEPAEAHPAFKPRAA